MKEKRNKNYLKQKKLFFAIFYIFVALFKVSSSCICITDNTKTKSEADIFKIYKIKTHQVNFVQILQ